MSTRASLEPARVLIGQNVCVTIFWSQREHFMQISINYSIIAFFVKLRHMKTMFPTYEHPIPFVLRHKMCVTQSAKRDTAYGGLKEHLNHAFVCSILYEVPFALFILKMYPNVRVPFLIRQQIMITRIFMTDVTHKPSTDTSYQRTHVEPTHIEQNFRNSLKNKYKILY